MAHHFTIRPIMTGTKGKIKQLRREGQIPVSIQHRGQETLHFQTEARPLDEFVRLHGEASMIVLVEEGGAKHRALVHDIQRDGIGHQLLQVTFQGVEGDEQVKVHIPLVFHGEPDAVHHRTATIQHSIEQVEVRCRPGNIPEHIVVEVGNMDMHAPLRVADLGKNERYEILTAPDTVIASLASLQAAIKEEAALVAAAAATASAA